MHRDVTPVAVSRSTLSGRTAVEGLLARNRTFRTLMSFGTQTAGRG